MIPGKVLGNKYIINGSPADVKGFSPDMSAEIYYEVVRLIDDKFLFLQDHLDRLRNSVSPSQRVYPGDDWIRENLRLLLTGNDLSFGNIRICLQEVPAADMKLLCYFIPYFYPDPEMYKDGALLSIYPHVRPNPGIKKWDDRFRTSVNRFIRENGIYEAILLNDRNEVTEGSRSNLFFIDSADELVTAPENVVLPGITRKYILEICRHEGIGLLERSVSSNELERMQACFITGTSPKVLPVRQLNTFSFDVEHPLLRLLMEGYDHLVEDHLEYLTSP